MNIICRKWRGTLKPNVEDKKEIFNIMHVVNTNNLSYCGMQGRVLAFSLCVARIASEQGKYYFQMDSSLITTILV